VLAFKCPACKNQIHVAEAKAGGKIACPSCGQRLQVPSPKQAPRLTPAASQPTTAEHATELGELVPPVVQPARTRTVPTLSEATAEDLFRDAVESSPIPTQAPAQAYSPYHAAAPVDACGLVSVIFGVLAVMVSGVGGVCLLFFGLPLLTYLALPAGIVGIVLGFLGRGYLRVAGITLNGIALFPALIFIVLIVDARIEEDIAAEKRRAAEEVEEARARKRLEQQTKENAAQERAQELERQRLVIKEAKRRAAEEEQRRRQAEEEAETQRLRDEERRREEVARRQEEAKKEAKRKADLEASGLPYYPPPTTLYKGKNAEEWANGADQETAEAAWMALRSLREEGTPFLLKAFETGPTKKAREQVLQYVMPEYVHAHDLKRIVACLDKYKREYISTRLRALEILSLRKESKDYLGQIEMFVSDLEYKPEVKQMLERIRKH
jgi:hypothetical protein